MYIKVTLGTLILVLMLVVAASYHLNKEGFQDISSNALINSMKTVTPEQTSTPTPQVGAISKPTPSPTTESSSSVPQRNDIVPDVSISGTGYAAMTLKERAELLKDIQKLVRNEILSHRATKPIIPGETEKCSDTDSTAQGKEYTDSCYKDTEYRCPKNPDGSCPPVPDMTQFIKKDAIPCWGCSLDY